MWRFVQEVAMSFVLFSSGQDLTFGFTLISG
jgi:hypothetical protein